jgi:hypothetical protein
MIKKKLRRTLEDVRSMCGADTVSEHYLVRATLKIKLMVDKDKYNS